MPRATPPLDYASPGTTRPGTRRAPGCLAVAGALIVTACVAWWALAPILARQQGLAELSRIVPLNAGDTLVEFMPYATDGPNPSPFHRYKLRLAPASFRALQARLTAKALPPPKDPFPWPWPVPADGVEFEDSPGGPHYLLSPGTGLVYVSIWID